jgi:hypothetical protein
VQVLGPSLDSHDDTSAGALALLPHRHLYGCVLAQAGQADSAAAALQRVADDLRTARKRKVALALPLCTGAPRGVAAVHQAMHMLVACSVNTSAAGEVCYGVGSDGAGGVEGAPGVDPTALGATLLPTTALAAVLTDQALVRNCCRSRSY